MRRLKQAERLWESMKMDDVKPSVVTYAYQKKCFDIWYTCGRVLLDALC